MWRRLDADYTEATMAPAPGPGVHTDKPITLESRRRRRIAVAPVSGGVWVGYLGGSVLVPKDAPQKTARRGASQASGAHAGPHTLRAPMAGRIVARHAEIGARCHKGETLVVLEAMKMEYRVQAPADGRILAAYGAPGEAVAMDAVLVTIVCDAEG